jgi:hypothetical protein
MATIISIKVGGEAAAERRVGSDAKARKIFSAFNQAMLLGPDDATDEAKLGRVLDWFVEVVSDKAAKVNEEKAIEDARRKNREEHKLD